MSSLKPNLDKPMDETSVRDELDNETASTQHHLVTKLRGILADPAQHTVGALAAAIEGGLAELSLLKDRLDLIAMNQVSDEAFSEPPSGATAAPGSSKEA